MCVNQLEKLKPKLDEFFGIPLNLIRLAVFCWTVKEVAATFLGICGGANLLNWLFKLKLMF